MTMSSLTPSDLKLCPPTPQGHDLQHICDLASPDFCFHFKDTCSLGRSHMSESWPQSPAGYPTIICQGPVPASLLFTFVSQCLGLSLWVIHFFPFLGGYGHFYFRLQFCLKFYVWSLKCQSLSQRKPAVPLPSSDTNTPPFPLLK